MPLSDESHLLLSLLLTAAVFFCAYRFSRRVCDGSFSKAICDALLLFALIVYVAVVVPGALHCLNLATMSIAALAMAAGLFVISRKLRRIARIVLDDRSLDCAGRGFIRDRISGCVHLRPTIASPDGDRLAGLSAFDTGFVDAAACAGDLSNLVLESCEQLCAARSDDVVCLAARTV